MSVSNGLSNGLPIRLAHHIMTWEGYAERNHLPFDLDTALAEIRAAGYNGVELGGDETQHGDPLAFKARVARHGLEIVAWATNVTANPWPPNTAEYQRAMDYAAVLGVKTIMVCGGFLPEQRRTKLDSDYALFAENLGAACEYATSRGVRVAYHPHTGCIVETIAELERLWRYLPNLDICIDTGHLAAVRCDPAELALRAGNKLLHVHLKDWHAAERHFAELGEGDTGLDFGRFFGALSQIGYNGWCVVERDNPTLAPAESARVSRQFLGAYIAV